MLQGDVRAGEPGTLIYSCEPVWAGIFGRMAGERLPGLALLGGAMILAGVLVSELRPGSRKQRRDAAQQKEQTDRTP